MGRLAEYRRYLRLSRREKKFGSLFLFVTSICNSKCQTCFYWDSLNTPGDLTFAQLEKLSSTMPRFHKLWISGGEPFMRKDLAEIITLFCQQNGVQHVNLPTNGLLPQRIQEVIHGVCTGNPQLTIDLNFSVDGLYDTHDHIRGVPRNFEITLQSIKEIAPLRDQHKKLRVNVVSVITRPNYHEILPLSKFVLENTDVSGHYFEVVRGNPMEPSVKELTVAELRQLYRELFKVHRLYAHKLFAGVSNGDPFLSFFKRWYYLGALQFNFSTQLGVLESKKAWAMPCTAGQTTAVIDHNGAYRSCELRSPIANVRDWDFDFGKLYRSELLKKEVAAIPVDQCWCTHSCFIQDSLRYSPRVLLWNIPWNALKTAVSLIF
ncbi:MAG: radical SAM protein [Acidobacteria bacterium]|nr:radical SAM protein [Acidobacteriota bacterium]